MASTGIELGTALAEQLQNAMQPKLAENGWSSGAGDDSALSEYIMLMLANGKSQEQIASELAADLLDLSPDDPKPLEFARWLFEQANALQRPQNNGSLSAESAPFAPQQANGDPSVATGAEDQDATMGGGTDTAGVGAVPTGPKSMRGGSGARRGSNRRLLDNVRGAMDRGGDNSIHKIRGAASRVDSHNRAPPSGPRGASSKMQNMMTGRGGQGMSQQMMANMASSAPQGQQMALFQMLEEQSRMMAQILGQQNGGQPAYNPKFNRQSRPLADRIDRPRQNGHGQNKGRSQQADGQDLEMDESGTKTSSAETTCKFQLQCTNANCSYAHQSPAAAPGISIDVSDSCQFGAACTNKKCVGTHPSPAQKRQYLGSTVDCKFYPNCTNPSCPFRHPSAPPCRNGADCVQKEAGCKFSHSAVLCRYTPCLNPHCIFRHAEGQRTGNQWTNGKEDGAHVSDRKFTSGEEGKEELIIPGRDEGDEASQEMQVESSKGLDVNGSSSAVLVEGGMDQSGGVA